MNARPHDTYDAVIAGAGPAGAALAAMLAAAGWKTLLVDPSPFPRNKVCGECLSGVALGALARLEVDRDVSAAAVRYRSTRIVLPGDGQRVVETPLDDSPQRLLLGISRYRLDKLLLDRARQAGAEVILGRRVKSVLVENSAACGVVLSAESPHAEEVTMRAPRVIAADGRQSKIVRQTGRLSFRGPRLVGFKRHWHRDASVSNGEPVVEMHSLAGGYLGLCPVDEGSLLNACGVLPRALFKRHRGDIGKALAELAKPETSLGRLLTHGSPASPWLTVPDVRRQLAVATMPGVLYVGDACGTIEPLAGQGMTMALCGAQLAAESLLSDRAAPLDEALQRRYQREWRSAFTGPMTWAARFGWLLRHPGLLAALDGAYRAEHALWSQTLAWGFARARVNAFASGPKGRNSTAQAEGLGKGGR